MSGSHSSLNGALLYIHILSKLSTSTKKTAQDILEALRDDGESVELRTVQRMLTNISNCPLLPIECERDVPPYRYGLNKKAPGLRLAQLSPEEALLLQLAKEQLHYQLPKRLLDDMEGLFDDATRCLQGMRARSEQSWMNKVRVVASSQPLIPPKVNESVFENVSSALYSNRLLRVVYVNKQGERKDKVVAPLALVTQGVRLYLVCRFEGYDNYRHLVLHRISTAEVLDDVFFYPSDFDLDAYIGQGHFGFSHGQMVKVRFEAVNWLAGDLLETPMSTDQTVELGETYSTIQATVPDTEALRWWLRGFGELVRNVSIEAV